MFGSAVHLIAFAHVAVLCICMVTSFTVSPTVQPKSFTTGPSTNITVPGSDSKSLGHTHTPDQNKSTTDAVTSTDTQTPHGSTNTDGQQNVTHPVNPNAIQPDITHTLGHTTKESSKNTSTTAESTTTKATTTSGGTQSVGVKAVGIFFLLLIIFIIFILAVVLYVLWKKGKRYSFDLTNGEHDTPLRSMEHTGTFEPSKGSTMNLDYVQEEKNNKTSPVANGCSGETPDQTPCSEHENVPEEDSFSSDFSLDLPVKKVEFNLDLELIGGDLEPAKEAAVETTDNDNENNNNDTNTGIDSADFFTEINLDDAQ